MQNMISSKHILHPTFPSGSWSSVPLEELPSISAKLFWSQKTLLRIRLAIDVICSMYTNSKAIETKILRIT